MNKNNKNSLKLSILNNAKYIFFSTTSTHKGKNTTDITGSLIHIITSYYRIFVTIKGFPTNNENMKLTRSFESGAYW